VPIYHNDHLCAHELIRVIRADKDEGFEHYRTLKSFHGLSGPLRIGRMCGPSRPGE